MPNLKAFVLMPFDDELEPVYTKLIAPPLTELGFEVTRADLSENQQQILKDIVVELANADLVIVDVTGLNGNVMYELGLAHAMGKRTVMITKDISELPFDLRSYRANAYSTDFTEAPKLKEKLHSIGQRVIDGTAEFSNPVQDFAPDFLARPEQISTPPKSSPRKSQEGESAPADEEADLGLLDYVLQLADSSDEILVISEAIVQATESIGERVEQQSERLTRASENLGPKGMTTVRAILRTMAKEFDNYSDELEQQNPLMEETLRRFGESTNGIARTRKSIGIEDLEQLQADIDMLRSTEESFADAYVSVVGFSHSLSEVPEIEKSLIRAAKRTARILNTTAELIDLGRSECARARSLMEEQAEELKLKSEEV